MNLRSFLDQLPRGGIKRFADRVGIKPIYLQQLAARQDGRQPSPALCLRIENETNGIVSRLDLRDDAEAIWPELAAKAAKAH
jgi:DNA-binding transcriptional regulator YdaS (Cro superfamily)